jgi:RHS repeat-associated protein
MMGPWGATVLGGFTQTSINFTGQRRDDTGLLFYNARYYDPGLGRFISADSIVPGAGSLTVSPSDSVAVGAWAQRGAAIDSTQIEHPKKGWMALKRIYKRANTGRSFSKVRIWKQGDRRINVSIYKLVRNGFRTTI